VRFVSKQYPLSFHDKARGAAKAVLCAHKQGEYWAFHDALYEDDGKLSAARYDKLAKKLKLNLKQFKRCRKSKEADGWVDTEMLQGADLGVSGTPVSFVNGFRVGGAVPFSHFKALIDAALGPDAAR
jgi:protein-disulfide isomerase